jgi:hypothetical protein
MKLSPGKHGLEVDLAIMGPPMPEVPNLGLGGRQRGNIANFSTLDW